MFCCLVALCLTCIQVDVAEHNIDGKALSSRATAHEVLMDFRKKHSEKITMTPGDEDKVLEVIVSDSTAVTENNGKVDLIEEVSDFVKLFDYLVIRGTDLDKIKGAQLVFGGRSWELRAVRGTDKAVLIRVLSKSKEAEKESEVSVVLNSKGKFFVEHVALRSAAGIDSDVAKMKDHWKFFDVGQDLQRSFYDETLDQNYRSLSDSLNQNSEIFNAFLLPARMRAMEQVNIAGILKDRRVSKMHEILSSLDPDVASELAAQGFGDGFADFVKVFSKSDTGPFFSRHAVEAKLFLCSEFCKPQELIQSIDAWNQWYEEEALGRSVQFASAKPDFLLLSNLQANSIAKARGFSNKEMNAWMAEHVLPVSGNEGLVLNANNPRVPKEMTFHLGEKPMMAFDSTPNQQDVSKWIPTIESSLPFFKDTKKQSRVLEVLRAEMIRLSEN